MVEALLLRELCKSFDGVRAVDGISLAVPEGSVFGLLGPNGAGKTTTIRMIMDIIRPDSGEISIRGLPVRADAKNRIGYLPEERGLYRKMKTLDHLQFLGAIRGMSPRAARRIGAEWLERLELAEWGEREIEELSKGMQQKVQFIGAILGDPDLLILDEPFSGMDPVNQNRFKDILLELNRAGKTVVLSTHVLDTAERMCGYIALIHRGRLVLSGPLSEIKQSYGPSAVQLEYEGDGAFLRELAGVEQVDDYGGYQELRLAADGDTRPILEAAASRLRVRRFEIVAPTLHNIFIEQVGARRDA